MISFTTLEVYKCWEIADAVVIAKVRNFFGIDYYKVNIGIIGRKGFKFGRQLFAIIVVLHDECGNNLVMVLNIFVEFTNTFGVMDRHLWSGRENGSRGLEGRERFRIVLVG